MKKFVRLLLAAVLVLNLAACSANDNSQSDSENSNFTVIKVGASPSPHAEILEAAKEPLAKLGYQLEIVEFTDYVLPNTALDSGDIDANFFQHTPYLNAFNTDHGTHIVSACAVHFEPLGIYPGKTRKLEDIKKGAVIAVDNDTANEARALLLLQRQGIIKLADDAGLDATVLDIVENPYDVQIYEVEAVQTVNVLPDVDFAVINGNYAVSAGILDQVLASESSVGEVPQTYGNILAVNEGHENDDGIKALVSVLNSEEIREFINTKYQGLFVPVF